MPALIVPDGRDMQSLDQQVMPCNTYTKVTFLSAIHYTPVAQHVHPCKRQASLDGTGLATRARARSLRRQGPHSWYLEVPVTIRDTLSSLTTPTEPSCHTCTGLGT